MTNVTTKMCFYGTALIVLVLDQISKWIIIRIFVAHESFALIPNMLYITFVTNERGAFGLISLSRVTFICASIIILTVLIWYYHNLSTIKKINNSWSFSLGTIAGGAIGNLLDRVRFGYVIDFIDIHINSIFKWPVFNLADTGITIGLAILIIKMLKDKDGKAHR